MPKINSSYVKICESSQKVLAQKFSIVTRAVVKYLKKKRKVGVAQRSATRKNLRNEKPSHSTKHVTESLFHDELDATTHEKQIADDVTNPFAFK